MQILETVRTISKSFIDRNNERSSSEVELFQAARLRSVAHYQIESSGRDFAKAAVAVERDGD